MQPKNSIIAGGSWWPIPKSGCEIGICASEGPCFGVIYRVRAEPDLRATLQVEIDIAHNVIGPGQYQSPAGTMTRPPPTAIAGRNSSGECGVFVGRAGCSCETGRARRAGGVDERYLNELALRGTKASDVKLA